MESARLWSTSEAVKMSGTKPWQLMSDPTAANAWANWSWQIDCFLSLSRVFSLLSYGSHEMNGLMRETLVLSHVLMCWFYWLLSSWMIMFFSIWWFCLLCRRWLLFCGTFLVDRKQSLLRLRNDVWIGFRRMLKTSILWWQSKSFNILHHACSCQGTCHEDFTMCRSLCLSIFSVDVLWCFLCFWSFLNMVCHRFLCCKMVNFQLGFWRFLCPVRALLGDESIVVQARRGSLAAP